MYYSAVVSVSLRIFYFNESTAPAKIIINAGAEAALRNNTTVSSLLPVGVLEIEGTFLCSFQSNAGYYFQVGNRE